MSQMLKDVMLVLIVGSASCVLIGVIITVIRAIRLIRRERVIKKKMWMDLRAEKTDVTGSTERLERW